MVGLLRSAMVQSFTARLASGEARQSSRSAELVPIALLEERVAKQGQQH